MKVKFRYLLLAATLCLFGCDIQENDTPIEEQFISILDDSRFESSFIPIDIKQMDDGGFMILSGRRITQSDFIGVTVIRTDAAGQFLSIEELESSFVQPVKELMPFNGQFYFVCMNNVSLRAQLMQISPEGSVSLVSAIGNSIFSPLVVEPESDGTFLLQSYNNGTRRTVISTVSLDGSVSQSQQFNIGDGDGVEQPIVEHFTRTGRQLPFIVGRTNAGLVYFNGFYNFSFSMVFTDLNSGDVLGVSQGQRDNAGISGATNINGNTFALATVQLWR